MSKERLGEIKENAIVEKVHCKYMDGTKGYWTKAYTLIEKDFNWLIEQVEEWKGIAKWQNDEKLKIENRCLELENQNKHYREKLIEILKKEHEYMEGYETETFTLAKTALGLSEKEVIEILEGEK